MWFRERWVLMIDGKSLDMGAGAKFFRPKYFKLGDDIFPLEIREKRKGCVLFTKGKFE